MNEIIIATTTLGITGFGFALVLSFLSRKLKVKEDPRIAKVASVLPGANCGACGFAGCRGFAQAVVTQGKIFSGCIPGGHELNEKIAKIIGTVHETSHKQKTAAVCRCGAKAGEKKESFEYTGPKNCKAAQITGSIDCLYGCLSYGDCVKVCPSGAITLKNKKIYVDIKMHFLRKCVETCPRKPFELVPVLDNAGGDVCCNNADKLNSVRNVSAAGALPAACARKINNSLLS